LPVAFILLPAFIWMGYYNYRVTGDPLLMPYSLVDKQYGSWSPFLWSNHPRPEPKFDHEIFGSFFVKFENPRNQFVHQHFLLGHLGNLIELYRFFLGLPLLLVILISSKHLMRNNRLRVPLLLLLLFYLGLSVEANLFPHYFAPATVLVILVAAAAIQDVSSRFSPGKMRLAAACAIFCYIAIFDVCRVMDPLSRFCFRRDLREFIAQRDRVSTFLLKQPGQHLVLVRYGSNHAVENEWVYNGANIDQSRIVWAHAMPGDKDDELLRYYPARRVWVLDEDEEYVTNQKEHVGFVRLSEEKRTEK
jgi:4-amino-4-deoxy-L-arabinose transferase-like glycosyltransferase